MSYSQQRYSTLTQINKSNVKWIFSRDQKERFLVSVSKGKNQMPPWGGLLSADDIESLWAYVIAGEKP